MIRDNQVDRAVEQRAPQLLAIGAFAAYILYRYSHLTLARRGMHVVLGIYFALMFVHAATGLSALGWHGPETMIGYVANIPQAFASLFS